jgi:hypothetical protein
MYRFDMFFFHQNDGESGLTGQPFDGCLSPDH